MVKNLPARNAGETPRRRKWQPTLVFLSGKSHGERNLAGCVPWGPKSQTRLKGFSMHAQEREQKAEAAGDGMRLGSWPACPVVCPLPGRCGAQPILSYADFEWDQHLQ